MTSKVLLPGFIITTLFFSPFFAIGQMKLDTEKYYCHYVSIDNGSSCFKFNKDKRFYFKEQGDLTVGGRFAQGFYTFYKDSLMLNYATEPVLVSNVERREWNEQSDSITIRFKVTNIDDICGVPCVFFLKEGKMFEPNRAYGAEYRFKKQKGTMVFKSASLGYSTVYFAFSGEESTEVRFNLRLYEGSALSGFTEKARVIGSRDGLVTAIMFENGTKIFLQE